MKPKTLLLLMSVLLPNAALAHTPLFSCYDFGDNTILCEGGFSDGSSASGVEVLVVDGANQALIKSEINQEGEIEFAKPAGDYKVQFNAGPGHSIEVDGKNIVE
ncbi:hypothetical protein FCU94_01610 [Vibrio sp. JPW-9-11-11]|uniref:hypothetical protein n=1 Tax=Vibrio sp. JPW-9-11-11 TaxID=1416532 RepID=UPI001592D04D|nr:hypothetical protein [Vibrio sp. JPW-9-11-11]NVD05607.1 hypothetical protein [Vibrio sp. JPW-9-11-11]